VDALTVQADGKVLTYGKFPVFGGLDDLLRLQTNGALDRRFDPGVNSRVYSLALQAERKILLGGQFVKVGEQPRNRLGRLHANGALDTGFDLGADNQVSALAVQPDGKILLGGSFTTLGGQSRKLIGRLNNTAPAWQRLTYDGATISWLRGGTGPEVWRTLFESSDDGVTWTPLGAGTRIVGLPSGRAGGWELAGVSLSNAICLRARGFVTGDGKSSGWWLEDYLGTLVWYSQPTNRTAPAGDSVRLDALAGGAKPLSYQWLKDGLPLRNGRHVAGATSPTLTLSNVFGADAAGYNVIVSNFDGSRTSLVARLTVIDPFISAHPASQAREPGQSAAFSVTAVGTQPLSHQWWHNGSPIPGATNADLSLTDLQAIDAGEYVAVATNLYGNASSIAAEGSSGISW
jgi:hypothetical protein